MTLRRGFKSEANQLAREIRSELGLSATYPLDPWELANYLEIPVVPLREFKDASPFAVRHFTRVERSAFSGVTVFDGRRRMIVYNDAHSSGRQSSNITHELSHALLLHPPTPAINDDGFREWNRDIEEEANWLAGALLITEEAALRVVRQSLTNGEAAKLYGVTSKMMTFRINVTGAVKRVARERNWYAQRTKR